MAARWVQFLLAQKHDGTDLRDLVDPIEPEKGEHPLNGLNTSKFGPAMNRSTIAMPDNQAYTDAKCKQQAFGNPGSNKYHVKECPFHKSQLGLGLTQLEEEKVAPRTCGDTEARRSSYPTQSKIEAKRTALNTRIERHDRILHDKLVIHEHVVREIRLRLDNLDRSEKHIAEYQEFVDRLHEQKEDYEKALNFVQAMTP